MTLHGFAKSLGAQALDFGGFGPPRQQGDGGDQQANENDLLHVLDGMLRT
jgi:hypothetical protein